jgi:hypothetical protein
MKNSKTETKLTLVLDESGAVAVFVAIVFAVLCGFGALAFDIGHMVMVKAELQRTADAAALAGAMGLVPYNNPGPNQTPYWVQGESKAHALINNAANQSDNQRFTLTEGTIAHGYWLLKPPAGYAQPPLTTAGPFTTGTYPEPAIRVTLSRNVHLYLSPLIGIPSPKLVRATATAILTEANCIIGHVPIAVNYDTAFNNDNGTVVIDTTPNQPITVNSNKDQAGWYTMALNQNNPESCIDTPLIAGTTTNPDITKIYLQPGAEVTLENQLVRADMNIVLPVVASVSQKDAVPIVGFVAFHVDSTSGPIVKGHFIDHYYDPTVVPTEGTGIISGVAGTPKLVGP